MKNLVLLLIVFLCYNIACSQLDVKWEEFYGIPDSDLVYDSKLLLDNSLIIVGSSKSLNDGFDNNDGWVFKVNEFGDVLWEKRIGGLGRDGLRSCFETSDGGIIIGGGIASNDGIYSTNKGSDDAWVIKIDAEGNIEWEELIGGTNTDILYDIIQTNDGGYIFAGATQSDDFDISGEAKGSYDLWVVKLDENGFKEWDKVFGGSNPEFPRSILQTEDNEYLINSRADSFDGDLIGRVADDQTWILKLNSIGEVIWSKFQKGSSRDMYLTCEEEIMLVGLTDNQFIQNTEPKGDSDLYLAKLDSQGELLWQNLYGGSKFDSGSSIVESQDGGFIIGASTYSNDKDVSNNFGDSDCWILKIDNQGVLQWEKSFGTESSDFGGFIIEDKNNDVLLIGNSRSKEWPNDPDANASHDCWVIKAEQEFIPAVHRCLPMGIHIFPNPSHDFFIIQNSDVLMKFDVAVMNAQGKIVFRKNDVINELIIDNIPNGQYTVSIISNNQLETRQICIF